MHETRKKELERERTVKEIKEERDANLLPARLDRISPDATQKEEEKKPQLNKRRTTGTN